MGKLEQKVIALLCFTTFLACSATRREDLERAAELAVEKAAERAAERAVEKALESGNTTTESKTVRESYSSVRKVAHREEVTDNSRSSSSMEDKVDQEEDIDDWTRYRQRFNPKPFKNWSGSGINEWKRFPRSETSAEDGNWMKRPVLTVDKKIPIPVPVEKKVPYMVYQRVPYEVKVPVPQPYTVEKKVPYPVKVFVNVPVEVPQPYTVEKKIPYEVKVDRPVPYKVEVPVPQPYTVEKKIPVEVKVPLPQPYTVDKTVPYEVEVPVKVPQPYEVEKKVPLPVKVIVPRPYPLPIPKPYPVEVKAIDKPYSNPVELRVPESELYESRKPIEIDFKKLYFAPIKVSMDRPYEVPIKKPVLLPIEKPFPYWLRPPIPMNLDWNYEWKDKEYPDTDESFQDNDKRRTSD